jgi:tRNA (adenine37-N6)-methyltransferase
VSANHAGIRAKEVAIVLEAPDDARLRFIGHIRTPWKTREDCPRQGTPDGPECRAVVLPQWAPALAGLEFYERVELLYWLDMARRDLVLQNPAHDGKIFGTFSLRSPVRPNPIGTSLVWLASIVDNELLVRGLDCLEHFPIIPGRILRR